LRNEQALPTVGLVMPRQDRAKKSDGIFHYLERGGHNWTDLAREALRAQGIDREWIEKALPGLVLYLEEVVRWGARVDLIAPSSLGEFLDLSLADAAVLARHELLGDGSQRSHWVDVGSGGGAPGIPLGILLRASAHLARLTLVEPRDKRVSFLRTLVGRLEMAEAEVLRSRSDTLESNFADVAVARATLPPPEWVLEGGRLAPRVWVLLAQGEAPPSPPGFRLDADISYVWPSTGRQRRALRYGRQ
jgi:16S rRNA G527 N7-methylase RsmG